MLVDFAESIGFYISGEGVGPQQNINKNTNPLKKRDEARDPEKRSSKTVFYRFLAVLGVPRGGQVGPKTAKNGFRRVPKKRSKNECRTPLHQNWGEC